MTITIRGETDDTLELLKETLFEFERQHLASQIGIYRRNSLSARLRVIDPCFIGMGKSDRHELVWGYLKKLPDEIQGDLSMLVLLAPGEEQKSMGNLEFEDPTPSLIP